MPGLAQEAEGVGGIAQVPGPDRGVLEHAALEQVEQLDQHLLDAVRARFDHVEGAVLDPGVGGGDLPRVADVGLAHLEEAAAARQQAERGVDEVAGKRVQDHVDSPAAAGAQELLLELQRARRGDPLVLDSERAHGVPLGRAGGREDLGPEVARELHGGHADAARGRVHEQLLAGPQLAEVDQAVVGGEEGDRDRGRLGERPAGGHRREHAPVGHRQRAERVGDQAHHPIAGREVGHLGADLDDHAGALAADRRLAGVEAEGDQRVAEVEAGGAHRDPHLARAERRLGAGVRPRAEILERPPLPGLDVPGAVLVISLRPHPGKARAERLALAQGHLGLPA